MAVQVVMESNPQLQELQHSVVAVVVVQQLIPLQVPLGV
jgi:hypothetical protein